MPSEIQLDCFSSRPCGCFSGFAAAAALILLPANNLVKFWWICLFFSPFSPLSLSFFFFHFTRKVGCGREWQSSGAGLPPQECGLSQISVPPPSPPPCHSKQLIVEDTTRASAHSLQQEEAFLCTEELQAETNDQDHKLNLLYDGQKVIGGVHVTIIIIKNNINKNNSENSCQILIMRYDLVGITYIIT